MPLAPLPPRIDFRLNHRLRRVAGYLRAIRFHRWCAILWSSVAIIAAGLSFAQQQSAFFASYAAHLLVPVFVGAAAVASVVAWRDQTTIREAARYLGRRQPEANSSLQAAVEQVPEPGGDLNFLQRRVVDDALRYSETSDWYRQPRRDAWWLLAANGLAMAAALGVSLLVLRAHRPAQPAPTAALAAGTVEVTPGDVALERGSTVLVGARFADDTLPSNATLIWQASGGEIQRANMHRSLSDPVFAFTLNSVAADTSYHVEHDGKRTQTFAITVFDRPALLKADAALDFPDYTGLPERRIADTRRVSAVVGTKLDYEFAMNKPLARATLRTAEGAEVPLEPFADRTRFRLSTVLQTSAKYALQLIDSDGRTNPAPIDIRIEALENRRPELKLIFPRGDQRVSPLEEMQLQGEARDDFGLRDYGLGISVADGEPNYLSLAAPPVESRLVEAKLDHLLRLEDHSVKADQLVTWFAWADDIGPDGAVRRSTSDVFFAEVRRLEEIFRENANGGGQNQGGGNTGGPGQELIELQRQISIGIWKLRQQDTKAPAFATDAVTLLESQTQAQQQLATVRERLEEASARAAADAAEPLMEQSAEALGEVVAERASTSLETAWAGARGAYQALLRMQSRDTNVSQSRGSGQGSGNRSRDQLNELEFRNEEDRYETETQAQPPPTPEEREQLGVLAKLRELSRRQQDLNTRLQELQTALAAATDEAEREAIRRELKRLEDEQRQMLSTLDETRQRVDRLQPGQQTQQAREQLDQTRQDMQRAGEQLEQGQVSQALAAGTRAQENLQRTSEDLRQEAAGRFGDQMREARRQARELTANQENAMRDLEQLAKGQQSLDDSAQREALAQQLQEQGERREQLLDTLRQITEDSEGTEPRLHRQLYDLLREQGQSGVGQELTTGAEMLRRGFVEPTRERQAPITRELEKLQRSVERAAGAVLGDETSELRFAQRELEDLTRELKRERGAAGEPSETSPGDEPAAGDASNPAQTMKAPGELSDTAANQGPGEPSPRGEQRAPHAGDTPGQQSGENVADNSNPGSERRSGGGSAAGGGSPGEAEASAAPSTEGERELAEFTRNFGGAGGGGAETARGPLTGRGFGDWADRLRTVEELMESPEQRQRLAGARFQAEEFRRANQRKGEAPRWDMVEMGIVAPLEEARAWLRQELNRREQPDALQPVDRDPVPERYAESVRKYYEALGQP